MMGIMYRGNVYEINFLLPSIRTTFVSFVDRKHISNSNKPHFNALKLILIQNYFANAKCTWKLIRYQNTKMQLEENNFFFLFVAAKKCIHGALLCIIIDKRVVKKKNLLYGTVYQLA